MQKHRLSSFLHTNTTALYHGLWLGWIVPTSNIAFTFAQTPFPMGEVILWKHSLKGSSSTTLISYVARSVQPSFPGSNEEMSWYSANKPWVTAWFILDYPSSSDKSIWWRSTSFLLSTDILAHWIPCMSSGSSKVLGANSTGDITFTATTWVTLMPLVVVIRIAIKFITTTATCLLPKITLVYVFITLRPRGKWGPWPPIRDWVITCMLFPRRMVFIWQCMILDEKASISSFFVNLTSSFKSVRSTVWCMVVSFLIKSSAYQHANSWAILNPIKEADNSSISHNVDDPIDGGCTQSNQYSGAKNGRVRHNERYLIFVIAPNSFYLNPYDDVTQGQGEYSSETIDAQGTISQVTQSTNIQRMSLNEPLGQCINVQSTIQKSPTALTISLDQGCVLGPTLPSKVNWGSGRELFETSLGSWGLIQGCQLSNYWFLRGLVSLLHCLLFHV